MPNPVDPFGMADLAFAQAPRGLADPIPALMKRRPDQSWGALTPDQVRRFGGGHPSLGTML
jgi:hypothetical protein